MLLWAVILIFSAILIIDVLFPVTKYLITEYQIFRDEVIKEAEITGYTSNPQGRMFWDRFWLSYLYHASVPDVGVVRFDHWEAVSREFEIAALENETITIRY